MDAAEAKKFSVESEQLYNSVSVGRHANNISRSNNYLLYSKSNVPILYNLKTNQVDAFLNGHKGEVNGQGFIENGCDDIQNLTAHYVISTSYDKSAIIWQIIVDEEKNDANTNSKILYSFRSPTNQEFTTRCSYREGNHFVSITSTIDGLTYLWSNDKLVQTVETKYCSFNSKMHTLFLNYQTGEKIRFLFLAGSDNVNHIYQLEDTQELGGDLNLKLNHVLDLSGHTDWVQCIDILDLHDTGREREFLLASASQDGYIRMWLMNVIDHDIDSKLVRTKISKPLETNEASTASKTWKLTGTLETILIGHAQIVYSLKFFKRFLKPESLSGDESKPSLITQLLSCSVDKTAILWRAKVRPPLGTSVREVIDEDINSSVTEVWDRVQTFGETGETNLPFLSVCVSEDEKTFYVHSLRGAVHSWNLLDGCWQPKPLIMGHFEPVTDLAWEKTGAYLLSSSLDKTCRLHARAAGDGKWHEIARPQVHGHEINCLVSIDFTRFVTGAEEKILRAFDATLFFLENFKTLTKQKIPEELDLDDFPSHAQLPALGLSNKGAEQPYDIDNVTDGTTGADLTMQNRVSKMLENLGLIKHLDNLPIEEILLQYTLWWETKKLFGHCNELHALAIDSKGSFMASASRANRSQVAFICVWNCKTFQKTQISGHHSLTVTRLKFSPNDKYLLSVSRDRTWLISKKSDRPFYKEFIGSNTSNSAHERIIWDCCWTFDSSYFMTVSRDKKAVLWSMDQLETLSDKTVEDQANDLKCVGSKLLECSIQAVDSPNFQLIKGEYLFALGFEDGSLELHSLSPGSGDLQWQSLKSFKNFHHLPVKRLAFKPDTIICCDDEEFMQKQQSVILASGAEDCMVQLTQFKLNPPLERILL